MARLDIKYRTEGKALPPRPVKVSLPGWGGSPDMKKENGSQPQPWHCPLHMEGATHGVELLYQYDTECHVVNERGTVRIYWDYTKEPGGVTSPSDFTLSVPPPSKDFLFATSIDLQVPPGYVMRTEPHPRFFADTTGTVPAAVYGHVHSEWWPKKLFVVFKIPPPGQRIIFRKGEPYVQILIIPDDDYEIKKMSPEEDEYRKKMEADIKLAKSLIAKNVWNSADGMEFNDHYKVLERAFEKEGMKGVEDLVRWGVERYEAVVPKGKSIDEYIELARQYHAEGKLVETKEVLHHAMRLDTRNAEIYNQISALEWDIGIRDDAVRTMKQAVALQPRSAVYHTNLGEMLRQLGRAEEAESEFNASLSLNPNDAGVLAMLGLAMAQRGQLTQGLERCRAAAQMAPHDPSTHYMFGLVLAQTGRHAEAQAKYEAALAINPEFAPAREAMQKLLTPASPQSQP